MKVKNISGIDLTVIGVGLVAPDEIIEVADDFNNANFQKVGTETKKATEKDRSGKK